MDSFFAKLVPFVDCSDQQKTTTTKNRVSKPFCLACRYNVASAVVGGLSYYWVVKIAVVVRISHIIRIILDGSYI